MAAERRGPLMHVRIGMLRALNRDIAREYNSDRKDRPSQLEEGSMKTVLTYVDTNVDVGDAEHSKVFANQDPAERWFRENDAEGVAFEYEVIE
jgi:hypothetical protein